MEEESGRLGTVWSSVVAPRVNNVRSIFACLVDTWRVQALREEDFIGGRFHRLFDEGGFDFAQYQQLCMWLTYTLRLCFKL